MFKSKEQHAGDALDDDEYLAQLLAKDARETSLRYSALGMYAAAPKRPTDRIPRPNTRFLKNIIRDTDAHNANLKGKEEQEARERMRQLRKGTTGEHTYDRHDLRESKRRRVEIPGERDRKRSHRTRDVDREDCEKSPGSRRHRDKERDRHDRIERDSEHRSRRSRSTRHREDDRDRDDRHRDRRRREERRSRSPDGDREDDNTTWHSRRSDHSPRRRKRRSRSRSRSHSRSRHRAQDRDKDDDHRKRNWSSPWSRRRRSSATPAEARGYKNPRRLRHTSPTREEPRRHMGTRTKETTDPDPEPNPDADSASDSDPLSNLIGPLPPSINPKTSSNQPIRTRGRGAYKSSTSNIDAHFADGYDPALDVHLEDDDDINSNNSRAKGSSSIRPVPGLTDMDNDWDMALEALRDRARWRQQGADRLREVGFEESVVSRFVNNRAFGGLNDTGAREGRDIADVRWAKKGEGREWDRGKVLDDEGHVDLKAPW